MRSREHRPVGALVVTAIIHIVVIAVVMTALRVPVLDLLRFGGEASRREQVTFVTPPPPAPEPPVPLRDSSAAAVTDAPPVSEPPALVPPVVVPTEIVRGGGDSVARDSAVGRGDPVDPMAGLRRPPLDPRLVGPVAGTPRGAVRAPRFSPDSAASSWVAAYWDSVARVQASDSRDPMDWTVRRGEDRYGLDPQFIYFGKFKLPTALLALLPINVQGNPTTYERNRALNAMREDILYHAMRAENADDFNASVKRIRERVERERAAKQAAARGKDR